MVLYGCFQSRHLYEPELRLTWFDFFYDRRGHRTRTLDTRLGVEQLRFRNLKIQKAFGRVSIKLQYLQGRILGLEENSLPLHEAQELIHKEIEDMADQTDGLKQDLEHGLKQLDEQMSEEREQSTIEMKALTDRVQKLEDELGSIRNSNSKYVKKKDVRHLYTFLLFLVRSC